jgi:hypothetical protein
MEHVSNPMSSISGAVRVNTEAVKEIAYDRAMKVGPLRNA